MDRTERILNLVTLFLDAPAPLTWTQLRDLFPEDYGAPSRESAERKFERDKADLIDLGLPLQYRDGLGDEPEGYWVDRSRYYLPLVKLDAAQMASLCAAGVAALQSGSFPFEKNLRHALRKLSFWSGDLPARPRVRWAVDVRGSPKTLAAQLDTLWGALHGRKAVQLTYRSPHRKEDTERLVHPYGLALRRGVWCLVGHCHLRQSIRTFHVHRIASSNVNSSKPKSPDYDIPPDFKVADHVADKPWQHRFHAPVECVLEFPAAGASQIASWFSDAPPQVSPRGLHSTLRAHYLDGLVSALLALRTPVRVLKPKALAEAYWQKLERISILHGGRSHGGR